MLQARRAFLALISVVAVVAGSTPAAFAQTGSATVATSAAPTFAVGTSVRADSPTANSAPTAAGLQSLGYWLVASDGGIFSGGDATFHGSTGAMHLNRPIVGLGVTASGNGYRLVASDGGIFSFGDATFHGSTGAMRLNRPIVGIASTLSGHGYWLVASDGGIFSFGDATFRGSTGAMRLNRPIVGIASTPSGHGYWLVASDGGIFSFGDAEFDGSTGGMPLHQPIVGMAATASGHGYWFVAADGGVFSFGDAGFFGSAGALGLDLAIVGMVATAPVAVPAPAAKLAVTVQPSGAATGGSAFAAQPVVTIQDATGHTIVANTSSVTLALTVPGSATLACTANPKAAVAGVAAFAGCNINLPGTYTLTASDGALTAAVSSSVLVTTGGAAKLAFTTQPSGSTGGVAFGTPPVVKVQDLGGNTVTGDTSSVTLAITNPAGATLACTSLNPLPAVAGVAAFIGCKIDRAAGYTLTATDGSLTSAVSSGLTITVGSASKLAFTTQPSGSTGGVAFGTPPVVKVQDLGGNTVTGDTSSVTLAITTAGGATLTCTSANPLLAVAGVAAFIGCKIDLENPSFTLTATDGALTSAVSSPFAIAVGGAAKLLFLLQPSGSTLAGAEFADQPAVRITDLGGNTVTGNTSSVTLAITAPGAETFTCSPNPRSASSGVAIFAGCQISLIGTYTLTATDGSLTAAVSNTVSIV